MRRMSGLRGLQRLVSSPLLASTIAANRYTGYAKAQYAAGYFTEMGVGCRRDPLEANVWYVRAADQGDEKARQRLQIIRDAAAGGITAKPQLPIDDKKKKGLLSKFR